MHKIRLMMLTIISMFFLIFPKSYGQWTQSKGLENASVTSFTSVGDNLLAGVEGGYIYLSQDSGATWIPLDTIASVQFCPNCTLAWIPSITLYTDGTDVFAGSAADSGSVHFSADSGLTWKEKDSSFVENINCFTSIGEIIFAGTNNGVFYSTNNGTSWSASNNGLSFGNYDSVYGHAPQVVSLATKGAYLFAGTTGEGVFFSSDSGKSWTEIDSGLTNLDIYGLAAIDTDLFAGTFKFPGLSTGGVYNSSNNGKSWRAANSGLTDHTVNVLNVKDSLLFVGTNGSVFVSTDRGASWKSIDNRTFGASVLAVFGSYLLTNGLSNENGVWRYPLSQFITSVTKPPYQIPNKFELEQNFPNPFNPTTVIIYLLPVTSDVNLEIYDILGRRVTTLVDKRQNAGIHSVTFNAVSLSSGIYFYNLTAGNFTETKKLMLIK